jgi:S1-C subfamily serine protease
MVDSVEIGGAGERAGLRKGDLILKIDGQDITGPNTLRENIRNRSAGSTCTLDLLRNNLPQRMEVVLK